MTIRVITRHSGDFDITTDTIDPAKSPYVRYVDNYVRKIQSFYNTLTIRSAIWTTPESQRPDYFEASKPVEYVLEVNEDRAVAYTDELT